MSGWDKFSLVAPYYQNHDHFLISKLPKRDPKNDEWSGNKQRCLERSESTAVVMKIKKRYATIKTQKRKKEAAISPARPMTTPIVTIMNKVES
jgi:hypothetical protein